MVFHMSSFSEKQTFREKRPYLEFSWSAFSRIRTKLEKILRISPYSVWTRENMGLKNSKYGHFSRSENDCWN